MGDWKASAVLLLILKIGKKNLFSTTIKIKVIVLIIFYFNDF